MLRTGIVVATHPEDHSVDIVMADNGDRLVGVQVLTGNGSTRTGTVDMPAITPAGNKWDVSKRTGQDMHAIVGFIGPSSHPVVLGFRYPQINQMLLKDPKARRYRHQSDVETIIDGEGNIQLTHPSGLYIRIGENPDVDALEGKHADGSSTDRNTGRQASVRVYMAGGKAVLTISPDGTVLMTSEKTVTVDAKDDVTIKTPTKITLDTPLVHCTDALTVDGILTYNYGMAGHSGDGSAANFIGNINVTGNVTVTGNVSAGGSVVDGDGDGGA